MASSCARRGLVRYCCDVIEDAKNWRVHTADVLGTLQAELGPDAGSRNRRARPFDHRRSVVEPIPRYGPSRHHRQIEPSHSRDCECASTDAWFGCTRTAISAPADGAFNRKKMKPHETLSKSSTPERLEFAGSLWREHRTRQSTRAS